MMGAAFSIAAGILITLQSVFNARASEKMGLWETNVVVHVLGLSLTLFMLLFFGQGNIMKIQEVNKLYLFGGFFGAAIIFSVMKSVNALGPTMAMAILLITQLIVATVVDGFGLFDTVAVRFELTKLGGIILMIAGIIVFNLKG